MQPPRRFKHSQVAQVDDIDLSSWSTRQLTGTDELTDITVDGRGHSPGITIGIDIIGVGRPS